jgi:hypothetical protein
MNFSSFRTCAFGGFALMLLALPARAHQDPDFDEDAKPILRLQPHLLSYVEHNFEVRDVGLARVPGDEERHPTPPFIFQARPRGSSGAYFITLLIQPGPQGRILKVIDHTQPNGRPPGLVAANPGPEYGSAYPPPQETPSVPSRDQAYAPQDETPPVPARDERYAPPAPVEEQPAAPAPSPQTAPTAQTPQEMPVAPTTSEQSPPTSATPSGPISSATPSGPISSDGQTTTSLPPAPSNSPGLQPPPDPAPSQ